MMWKLSGQGSDMIGAKYFTHLYSAVKSFQMVCLVERCPNQDCSWDTLWLSNMAMSNLANPPMSVDEFAIDAPFFIMFSDVQSPSWYLHSMDWFKGHFTGKPHDLHGKIPLVSGSQIIPIQPIHGIHGRKIEKSMAGYEERQGFGWIIAELQLTGVCEKVPSHGGLPSGND